MDENNMGNAPNADQPGRGLAIAALVLGIVSIIFVMVMPLIGLVTGIVGVVCASKAKSQGYIGGMQTGGFVCSLIGLVLNATVFVACVACAGMFGAAGALGK